MLRACIMIDFGGNWENGLPLIEFSYNNTYQLSIKMAPYEALYGRKCRSPIHWDEVGEMQLLGPDLIQDTVDVVKGIHERMKTAQDRQQKYANQRRWDLEFDAGDHLVLKVTALKGIFWFGKRGRLSPPLIGPFKIFEKPGSRAYRLALPSSLSQVHNVFHVSMLKKNIPYPDHVLFRTRKSRPNPYLHRRTFQNTWPKNLEIKKLIQWKNHSPDEAMWELEHEIMSRYPDIAGKNINFGYIIFLTGEICNTLPFK